MRMYPLKPEVYEEVLNLYHAREYVFDHYEQFGFYPYDVEVDGQVYAYGTYWSILEDERFD